MKEIKLNKGYVAIVDKDDYEYLNQFRWTYSLGYAIRYGKADNGYKLFYMHRVINNTPDGLFTDHINRNKLDNRKCNLRNVTKSQNQRNVEKQSHNTSGFKGVSWHKSNKTHQTYIKLDGKQIALGSFKDLRKAAQAYNRAAVIHHGEYAKLNNVTYNLSELKEFGGSY